MKDKDTSLIVCMVRFASIMLIVGLVVGLFYREYSRKFLFTYPLQTQLSVGHHLSLAHGHTFLLGMVLPLALALVIVLLRNIHAGNDDLFGVLHRVFTFYMIGAVASLLLLYYKGTALIYLFLKLLNVSSSP